MQSRQCVHCHYDLSGLRFGAPCPECGYIEVLSVSPASPRRELVSPVLVALLPLVPGFAEVAFGGGWGQIAGVLFFLPIGVMVGAVIGTACAWSMHKRRHASSGSTDSRSTLAVLAMWFLVTGGTAFLTAFLGSLAILAIVGMKSGS